MRDNLDGTYSISYDPKTAISATKDDVFLDVKLDGWFFLPPPSFFNSKNNFYLGASVSGGNIPVMLDLASHNEELEETMMLLQKARNEREAIEKTKEQLASKIEEEMERTRQVNREMDMLKEIIEKEKIAKEEIEKEKEKVEKELHVISERAKEQKEEDEKKQEELTAEIKGLKTDLAKEVKIFC